jgi:1-acyl-sn-glycerol-3-phosphate acyltransferase
LFQIEKFLVRLIILLFVRFQLEGLENVPPKGALLVVSNHLGVADPPVVGVSLRRALKFMAKEELFRNWFFAYFVRQFGGFPVYRGSASRQALHQAGAVLKSGGALVMFPEGKRSANGVLQSGQPGAALIAYHNKCRLLPVAISGTQSIRGLRWILSRPTVTLKIGESFDLPEDGHSLSREQLQAYTELIMARIANLLQPELRGDYRRTVSDEN